MNIHGLTRISSVAILGVGAVGGFVAAILWKYGLSVTCIVKAENAERVTKEGIRLQSSRFGIYVGYPQATTRLDYEPDLLFVTTKAYALGDALERIPQYLVARTIIIPLLNGIEHLQIVRSRLGNRVAVGMISGELKRENPCSIQHTSPHIRIELASDRDIPRGDLQFVAELLSAAGIGTQVLDREADVIWRKLTRLNAIAAITAASQSPIGLARTGPLWRQRLEGCAREGAQVARAEGVKISAETIMQEIDALPAELSSSMQRDIARGAPSELDAILGAVIRLGEKHSIPCPTIRSIYGMIQSQIKRELGSDDPRLIGLDL